MKWFFQLLDHNEILRRYIVMSAFDGTLTMLGIIIAFWVSGVTDLNLLMISSVGVIFATGVSGTWGGYLAEKAERKHDLLELHKLEPDADLSTRRKEFKRLAQFMGLANGLSCTTAGIIIILPFIAAVLGLLSLTVAFQAAIGLVVVLLVLLGSFTANIARESILKHAAAMVFAAIVVAVVIFLFEVIKVAI